METSPSGQGFRADTSSYRFYVERRELGWFVYIQDRQSHHEVFRETVEDAEQGKRVAKDQALHLLGQPIEFKWNEY